MKLLTKYSLTNHFDMCKQMKDVKSNCYFYIAFLEAVCEQENELSLVLKSYQQII